ncbi:hypothetical protein MRB53_042189 [Persea americana]|nr:hypothetical protein MRB53_042189 [Persea americana]
MQRILVYGCRCTPTNTIKCARPPYRQYDYTTIDLRHLTEVIFAASDRATDENELYQRIIDNVSKRHRQSDSSALLVSLLQQRSALTSILATSCSVLDSPSLCST